MRNKILAVSILALATGATTVTPAAAWCRWGGCGWGWGGPLAAGVVAGTAVGVAAAAAARPYPYPYYAPGGYYVCPPGYHFGPYRRACWANR